MASACVNNIPTSSAATSYTGYRWLSPRVSLSREEPSSPEHGDFEFRISGNNDNNVTMLSADQLFSDGKLVPLHFSSSSSSAAKTAPHPPSSTPLEKSSCKSISEDPYLFSPKAPRCSSRWRDLFGLKKLNNNQTKTTSSSSPSTSSTTPSNTTTTTSSSKSMLLFLNRNSKTASFSSVDSSLTLPLLKDSCSSSSLDLESVSLSSSRLSLSSSSSSHDHDELPRASVDAEKPITQRSGPKLRTRPKMENPRVGSKNRGGLSVDSPRMNPSGKVVFQSLERSSSSPSSFNGGQRYNNNNKHHNNNNRGVMERSYSGNVHVRITPVLNVPVCSLRGSSKSGVFGFGNLFSSSSSSSSSQKKESSTKSYNHHHHHHNHRNKKEEKEKEKENKVE